MTRVFMIGLPELVRLRVEAEAGRRDLEVSNIAAGVGNAGTFKLLPHANQAIYRLQEYVKDEADNYEGCFVLVLPYAQLPNDLIDELEVLKELDARVISPTPGESRWPSRSSARQRDQAFWDALYKAIIAELPGEALQLQAPSDYFQSLAANNPRLIIPSRSLESADDVAVHRYEFLRRAADALDQYACGGSGGRIDAFFARHGLDHAQSGGITATLKLHKGGEVSTHECHTHLKQGDNTTRIAAARVYYYAFTLEGKSYAALLYAGPHPDEDVTREWHFP
jgi:hypothetical protein